MVMSTKKIVRGIDKSLNKAVSEINASTPKPDMKDDGAELKAAVAPKKAMTFAEAFRAARKDPEAMKRGTFTYGGKSFSTKMAGEGGKKAAPKGGGATSTSKSPLADFYLNKYPKIKGNAANIKGVSAAESAAAQAKAGRSNVTSNPKVETKSKGDTYSSGVGGARSAAAEAARKSGTSKGILDSAFGHWVSQTDRNFQERQKKKYGKAAGGSVRSIDGCAIRGKTRAVRRGK